MAVLVTGGLGYIGSHTCVELMNSGVEVVVADNLYNCKKSSYDRIKALVGRDFPFYQCDIRDAKGLQEIFDKEDIHNLSILIRKPCKFIMKLRSCISDTLAVYSMNSLYIPIRFLSRLARRCVNIPEVGTFHLRTISFFSS